MNDKFSVCVCTEYSNNDVADVFTFDTKSVMKDLTMVGAYMLMRSIKSNGFDRGKVGIVDMSFYSKDGYNHYLYQMVLRKDGLIEFINPRGDNRLYRMDSGIWKSLVKNGFEFCMEQGIIF